MVKDYWFITRPKRKLNAVPEELAAFCTIALGKKWSSNRTNHLAFEEELEFSGTKRVGERRDGSGSGGRTHAALLYSLGLWFEKDEKVYLTLAGQSILEGKPPVEILKRQVLHFQYPSPYSDHSANISTRFKIRPFLFLLKLLRDNRINYLMQEEIAYIVAIEADSESKKCYESVVERIHAYRLYGNSLFKADYFIEHNATANNLMDFANTAMNWLDYTQLVYRETKKIGIDPAKFTEVDAIINEKPAFIPYPEPADIFQRSYGIDPSHKKDTRNLLLTSIITAQEIDKNRILRAFFNYSSLKPISRIDASIIADISKQTGVAKDFTEKVLTGTYPHGAIGGYLTNYRDMAFTGRENATAFEEATTNLFRDVFQYDALHLGQTGSKSAPDVLLRSNSDGYQAIIDNKAYASYSITGDHHNRMVHNYLEHCKNYSSYDLPMGFFTYISGGFATNIDQQIKKEVTESKVHGSGITVSTLITLIEEHQKKPFSHHELRELFSLDRQIHLSDLSRNA